MLSVLPKHGHCGQSDTQAPASRPLTRWAVQDASPARRLREPVDRSSCEGGAMSLQTTSDRTVEKTGAPRVPANTPGADSASAEAECTAAMQRSQTLPGATSSWLAVPRRDFLGVGSALSSSAAISARGANVRSPEHRYCSSSTASSNRGSWVPPSVPWGKHAAIAFMAALAVRAECVGPPSTADMSCLECADRNGRGTACPRQATARRL